MKIYRKKRVEAFRPVYIRLDTPGEVLALQQVLGPVHLGMHGAQAFAVANALYSTLREKTGIRSIRPL
jgi:hypothetical protein